MEDWQAGGGVAAIALTALLAYLRRQRRGGRIRARLHLSFRSPPSSEPEPSEPPPFPDRDTDPDRQLPRRRSKSKER